MPLCQAFGCANTSGKTKGKHSFYRLHDPVKKMCNIVDFIILAQDTTFKGEVNTNFFFFRNSPS